LSRTLAWKRKLSWKTIPICRLRDSNILITGYEDGDNADYGDSGQGAGTLLPGAWGPHPAGADRGVEKRERTVGQLVAAVDQPQTRVSTHLACLRHCGFVIAERRGKEVVYRMVVGVIA
jgi:DNA-binding transcriptional ArsR family regulator